MRKHENVGQLDIFAELAALAADRELVEGVRKLFASTTRGLAGRVAEFEQWTKQYGIFGCIQKSHAWRLVPTHSGKPTAECRASVLAADLGCDHYTHECQCVGGYIYRGTCTGCDWESDTDRAEESAASLDAVDHAHPGWRDDPVLDIGPRPDSPKALAEWVAKAEQAIGSRPPGWPCITPRQSGLCRAVPGRSPWDGYDIAERDARQDR